MATTIVNAESVLAIDVGSVTTRAILFDVVEGRYRFVAIGSAPTTAGAPFRNLLDGVHRAVEQLQTVTGRTFIGEDQALITPTQQNGSGVDRCVATISTGSALRAVLVGLLEDVSIQSAQNLVNSTYAQVLDVISLNDRRKTVNRLDAIIKVRPDLVVIAGGTDNGASQSVQALFEAVGLACYLLPKEIRPQVLFAGNSALAEEVKSSLGSLTALQIAPNIRPGLETEQLAPARKKLAEITRQARIRQIQGAETLDRWTGGNLLPSAYAFGRTIQFISKDFERTRKGVLGVDVGSAATTLAAGFGGDLRLTVQPHLGTGEGAVGILQNSSLEEIARWLPMEINPDSIQDYLYNKSLYPSSLPISPEDLAIEHALVTQALQIAVKKALRSFPEHLAQPTSAGLPPFEPIIAAGSGLALAPEPGQTLMMLLNGLLPTGVTTLALDQNNLATAIGAAADVAPLLTVQSLDASNFMNLCTVVSPVGKAAPGAPVMRVRVKLSEGSESVVDIKFGALEIISIPFGQSASVHVQPLNRFDVGSGPGRAGNFKINMAGIFGLVIDARGRPLAFPEDAARRLEMVKKWHWMIQALKP